MDAAGEDLTPPTLVKTRRRKQDKHPGELDPSHRARSSAREAGRAEGSSVSPARISVSGGEGVLTEARPTRRLRSDPDSTPGLDLQRTKLVDVSPQSACLLKHRFYIHPGAERARE